ncbi:MAG: acylphosphatase [Woeseia sp.]|nr:acylphosphatase [Woeseia sp.]
MCRLFKITGRVQGVFFRGSTRDVCVRLDVKGQAVNLIDGSVEVRICGDKAATQQVRNWLKRGPPMARVSLVRELVTQCTRPQDFLVQ